MKFRQFLLGIALTVLTVCAPVQSFAGFFYSFAWQSTATGPQQITTQNLNPSSGTPTVASIAVPPQLINMSTVQFQITGTYTVSGGLIPQVMVDGVNWVAISAITPAQTVTISSGATGIWTANIAGFSGFRLSANGAVTGTATITMATTPLLSTVGGGSGGGGGSVTQGTSPWVVSGTVTANAGTNLNTSLLALESGGNLATTVARLNSILTALGTGPLLFDGAGNLKVSGSVNSTHVGPFGQSNAAGSMPVVLNSDPDYRPASGSVTAADVGSATTGTLVTGTATVNSTYTVTTNGAASVTFQITNTGTRTAQIDESYDGGTTWASPITFHNKGAGTQDTSITANGVYVVNSAGVTQVRFRATAVSGTTTVQATGTASPWMTWITNTAFTANAGTNLNTSALALETGGNLATVATQTTTTATNTGTIAGAVASSILQVSPKAQTVGGASSWNNTATAITTAVSVKGSAGNLYAITVFNSSTTTGYYLQIFDSASVTLGTTVPIWVIPIPAGSIAPSGAIQSFIMPLLFGTNLQVAATTTPYGASAAPATTVYAQVEYK